jgi:hypothetical protein
MPTPVTNSLIATRPSVLQSPAQPIGPSVGELVAVTLGGATLAVGDAIAVALWVAVAVALLCGVDVDVLAPVAVAVGALGVAVGVKVDVAVSLAAAVGVEEAVAVAVLGRSVDVAVAVVVGGGGVAVGVGLAVGVLVAAAATTCTSKRVVRARSPLLCPFWFTLLPAPKSRYVPGCVGAFQVKLHMATPASFSFGSVCVSSPSPARRSPSPAMIARVPACAATLNPAPSWTGGFLDVTTNWNVPTSLVASVSGPTKLTSGAVPPTWH